MARVRDRPVTRVRYSSIGGLAGAYRSRPKLAAKPAVISFYGVRGIGSVYYLAYAGHHVELVNEGRLVGDRGVSRLFCRLRFTG